MMKNFLRVFFVLMSLFGFNSVYAGYGIDCNPPKLLPGLAGQTQGFSFTCKNNTVATFTSFSMSAKQLDSLPPANVTFSIHWPHTEKDIRPGDVGTVTLSLDVSVGGTYIFDFNKYYGGEEYKGIFCQNGKTPETCMYAVIASGIYAYVSDLRTNTILQCDVEENGNFNNCNRTGPTNFQNLGQMAIVQIGAKAYAYINGGDDNNTYACEVDPTTGHLATNCIVTTGQGGTIPLGIAFTSLVDPTEVYIGDADAQYVGGPVLLYPLEPDGMLGAPTANSQVFSYVAGFLTVATFDQTYIYVPDGLNTPTDATQSSVWQCSLDLATCVDSGAGPIFYGPAEITFIINGSTYAYVSNFNNGTVSVCDVNTSGKLVYGSCSTAYNTSQPNAIVAEIINNVPYVYIVASGTNNVIKCSQQPNGSLTNCLDSGYSGPANGIPFGLVFWP